MKRIHYIFTILTLLHFSCSNDDDSSNNLSIVYEQQLIENTFLKTGETLVPMVNWLEEKGTFSATTLTIGEDELVGRSVFINELTGALSWNRSLPLGDTEIHITASNSLQSATTTVTIKNTFTKGFFVGGFNNDSSDEPDYSTIENDTHLLLSEDGKATLTATGDLSVLGKGTWTAGAPPYIFINYALIDNPAEKLTMKGYMYATISIEIAKFSGHWGKGLNQDDNIENNKGVFAFELD